MGNGEGIGRHCGTCGETKSRARKGSESERVHSNRFGSYGRLFSVHAVLTGRTRDRLHPKLRDDLARLMRLRTPISQLPIPSILQQINPPSFILCREIQLGRVDREEEGERETGNTTGCGDDEGVFLA